MGAKGKEHAFFAILRHILECRKWMLLSRAQSVHISSLNTRAHLFVESNPMSSLFELLWRPTCNIATNAEYPTHTGMEAEGKRDLFLLSVGNPGLHCIGGKD